MIGWLVTGVSVPYPGRRDEIICTRAYRAAHLLLFQNSIFCGWQIEQVKYCYRRAFNSGLIIVFSSDPLYPEPSSYRNKRPRWVSHGGFFLYLFLQMERRVQEVWDLWDLPTRLGGIVPNSHPAVVTPGKFSSQHVSIYFVGYSNACTCQLHSSTCNVIPPVLLPFWSQRAEWLSLSCGVFHFHDARNGGITCGGQQQCAHLQVHTQWHKPQFHTDHGSFSCNINNNVKYQ